MRAIGQMVSIQPKLSKKLSFQDWQATSGKQAVGPQNINTEFICSRVIGIVASLRQIDSLISYELAPHPTAMFAENEEMRTTSKSVLKTLCEERNGEPPVVNTVDGCALLWTIGPTLAIHPCKSVCIFHSCGSQDLEKDGHHASATCGV